MLANSEKLLLHEECVTDNQYDFRLVYYKENSSVNIDIFSKQIDASYETFCFRHTVTSDSFYHACYQVDRVLRHLSQQLSLEKNSEIISANIKYLRQHRKETMEDLARVIGVSKSTVSRWEKGSVPRKRQLSALTSHFHISPDDIKKQLWPD